MKQLNVKKLILPNIPYVFIALLATKVSEAVRLAPGSDASTKLLNIMTGLNTAFHSLVPSFHPIDLCMGVAAAIAIRLAVYIKGKNAKKFRKNLEYGSARWGTAEDIKPYVDPAFENTENAAKYCRAVYDAGFSPVCPALFLPLFLRDEIPQEHKDGIDMAREYLRRAHVLVVCGSTVDESVKNDIAVAERLRITATTLDGILTVKGQGRRNE